MGSEMCIRDRAWGGSCLLYNDPWATSARAGCGGFRTGLPFPLPSALDQSTRRTLQISFSTPYRTSTSLNLTPLNSTQLTSLFDLLGLHFGASWLPQIDPRSIQDRSKSPLEALLFQKREFSRNIGRRSVWGLSRVPKTTQDRPKTAPRRSSRSAFSDLVFIFDFGPSWVRFWFHLGSILALFWISKSSQVPRPSRPC